MRCDLKKAQWNSMNSVNAGTTLYKHPKPLLMRIRSFLTEQEGRTAALARLLALTLAVLAAGQPL